VTAANHQAGTSRAGRLAVWLPGLAVALGAAVATVHGLYEVAVAAGVPAGIAWLYPLITDGLALVAYTATARLAGSARRYAWLVVALAAGLSGLAQAAYLAGTATASAPASTGGAPEQPAFAADAALRFGVGAWPAIAAAIVAHLLYLLAVDHTPAIGRADTLPATDRDPQSAPSGGADGLDPQGAPSPPAPDSTAPTAPNSGVSDPGPSGPRAGSVSSPVSDEVSGRVSGVVSGPGVSEVEVSARPGAEGSAPVRERARSAALAHYRRSGALPSVRELMAQAEVSRGTAADALKTLRAHPTPLHLITNQDTATPGRHTQP
jgi:hypothetical protein